MYENNDDSSWRMSGLYNWATLSTGLISRDHGRLLQLKKEQHMSAKLTEPLAACFLNESFLDAVKALAVCNRYNLCFVRQTHQYDQSDKLYFVVGGGDIFDSWEKAYADYLDSMVEDAIIVVATSREEAIRRRYEHPIKIDEVIASSDDVVQVREGSTDSEEGEIGP
ncbi:hypothetical protein DFH06DRAFT_1334744 [Mycena polygramma]|nr:hypothetical protein DFH06DRAFT_1334744 [Mycena polygramma]